MTLVRGWKNPCWQSQRSDVSCSWPPVCTHLRRDFVPLLFADPLQVIKVSADGFLFCYQHFLFFHTQHNIISKIQQNKTQTHTQPSQVHQKGRGRGKDNKNTKVLLYQITYVQQKTCQASMVEGLAPPLVPFTFTWPICRRLQMRLTVSWATRLGRVFWVIVMLEYPSTTHFQCPGPDGTWPRPSSLWCGAVVLSS